MSCVSLPELVMPRARAATVLRREERSLRRRLDRLEQLLDTRRADLGRLRAHGESAPELARDCERLLAEVDAMAASLASARLAAVGAHA